MGRGQRDRAKVRFVRRNEFGVVDHDVILKSGTTVHNPIRILPNGRGTEVIFTLFRQRGVSYTSVLKYFSPESTRSVTTFAPAPRRLPTSIAASTFAPEDVPAKSASFVCVQISSPS